MAEWAPLQPAANEASNPVGERRNARLGLILFFAYLAVYAVYVLINAFWPATMDAVPLAGVNLAVLYGFALIAGAIVLAGLYGWLCRTRK